MSLLVTGSLGIDSVITPAGKADHVLGGSAIYFSWAAAAFTKVRLVAVVGDDFPQEFEAAFANPNIDTTGLERRKGSKTFRWKGTYDPTMNEATTLEVDLNVLIEAPPKVPAAFKDSKIVFLAATHPNLQLDLLSQVTGGERGGGGGPKLSIADTRDLWIKQCYAESLAAYKHFDGIVLNDLEARLLTKKTNLVEALHDLQKMLKPTGPRIVLLKKGEHGCLAAIGNDTFSLPAYPTARVIDPTGAGDSFAGGLFGYLAAKDQYDLSILKNAIAAGTVMASFTIEDFSLNRLCKVTPEEIHARHTAYKKMLTL
ncbi:MAG: PfkB family carbohydrate kinase [Phycisphaerales bacterium]|nr:PfkB family carbohydrate kinase [Phycisphaerales bacterium]